MDQQQVRQEREAVPAKSEKTHLIAETSELRVVEYILQPGDELPWHHHTEVTDRFYCLQGAIKVEVRSATQEHILRPGESCMVSPSEVHRSSNAGETACRYLLVQGIGHYDFVKDR